MLRPASALLAGIFPASPEADDIVAPTCAVGGGHWMN
ncbi:hypothetical protein FALB51S_01274 [Frigidibacter albus]|uniref:Uncharacterized protein n=1 Tax=Frigidibacter mobilis TaxID=1335048 RepID=A0A165SFJ7_9RHOB|nr:hypothetical protein AKL17_0277 [Frigidibacter mobilis]